MAFVAGDAVGRAHHLSVELATCTVVVAHFYRPVKAPPLRPVQSGLQARLPVVRAVTKEAAVVHSGGLHDLARIQ